MIGISSGTHEAKMDHVAHEAADPSGHTQDARCCVCNSKGEAFSK